MKKSFSMVELIFAIIVIALAIGGLPAVLNQAKNSSEMSINQEAIWIASGFIFDIMDYQWDENNYDGSVRKVIDVVNGDSDLDRVGTSKIRVGHIKEDGRRSFFPSAVSATALLGIDSSDGELIDDFSFTNIDDIDDFIYNGKETLNYRTSFTVGLKGYKREYTADIRVFYINDNADGGNGEYRDSQNITFTLTKTEQTQSSNIKFIEVTIKDCITDDKILTLNSFSCNIGEYYDLMNKKSKVF